MAKGEAHAKAKKRYLIDEFFHPIIDGRPTNAKNELSVKGKVILYKGKPEIEVSDSKLINTATILTIVEP
ncbi:hypothetical protein [Mucilaginibacter ginkgonis]|uniref:Uncharacterized protein n=1 Tax=Mucilaginibacter ginkgonis TaxID=2682091 RepID=A0A6I4IMK9_9SPHI|nr:hypothetical protein [Mucilaginibacter ginkgonis]QQL50124.1 hypothetical protein GO620_001345 [Mucilaginibacter ginkgonis]